VDLVGPGGLLNQISKRVLETALEAEMSEHLGYDRHEFVGRDGGNSRNGIRSKTVLTPDRAGADRRPEGHRRILRPAGCQEAATPADRDRPDRFVAAPRGLATGEISAHFAEVYGASISKDTISKITDMVVEEMNEWFNRPLDRVYPVISSMRLW